jgi:hypothetical protein
MTYGNRNFHLLIFVKSGSLHRPPPSPWSFWKHLGRYSHGESSRLAPKWDLGRAASFLLVLRIWKPGPETI